MAELMLVNPRKRKTKSRKRRSPAQKAATAKLLAANRRRRGPARASKRRRSTALAALPRRARRVGARRRVATRRRYARNPIGGLRMGDIGGQLKEAGIMASAAFGLDVLTGFVMPYIPADSPLRTFPGRHAMKGAAALGLGMVAGMVTRNATARTIAVGALASVLWDAMRSAKVQYAPDIRLGDSDPLGMWLDDPNLGYVYEDPALTYAGGQVNGLTDQSQPAGYSYNSAELSY